MLQLHKALPAPRPLTATLPHILPLRKLRHRELAHLTRSDCLCPVFQCDHTCGTGLPPILPLVPVCLSLPSLSPCLSFSLHFYSMCVSQFCFLAPLTFSLCFCHQFSFKANPSTSLLGPIPDTTVLPSQTPLHLPPIGCSLC